MLEEIEKIFHSDCVILTPNGHKKLLKVKGKKATYSRHHLDCIYLDGSLVFEDGKFATIVKWI